MIDEELIKELAEKEFELREMLMNLGLTNANVVYKDRKKQAVEYAITQARYIQAKQNLDDAIYGRIAKCQKEAPCQ